MKSNAHTAGMESDSEEVVWKNIHTHTIHNVPAAAAWPVYLLLRQSILNERKMITGDVALWQWEGKQVVEAVRCGTVR